MSYGNRELSYQKTQTKQALSFLKKKKKKNQIKYLSALTTYIYYLLFKEQLNLV